MTRDEIIEYFENGLELVGDQMADKDKDAIKSCLVLLKQGKEEYQSWPRLGDTYFFISSTGSILKNTWDGDDIDFQRLAMGSVYKSDEEAEFAREQREVLAEMRKFAEPFDTKWDGDTYHYTVSFGACHNDLGVIAFREQRTGSIYFSTKERAEECIKAVGKNRIKKYYLGVE